MKIFDLESVGKHQHPSVLDGIQCSGDVSRRRKG